MRGKGSLCLLLTSFVLYVFDVGSDIYVAITYYQKRDYWWFRITIALVILPSIIVNINSLITNWNFSKKGKRLKILVCVFQLSVIQQYWEAFKRWKKMNCNNPDLTCNRNMYYCPCQNCLNYSIAKKERAKHAFKLALTCYIEAFAESAPQWCLQFYIMLRQWSFPWITVTSTVFSFLSLAWSITAQQKTEKDDGKNPATTFPKKSIITFTLWQFGILISRLSAIVIFAYAFRSYVFVVIIIHWTAVIVVMLINEYSRDDRNWRSAFGILFVSYPMVFHVSSWTSDTMFDSFGEKTSKRANYIYCAIFFLENVIMVSFSGWYEPTSTPHMEFLAKIVSPLVIGGFVIGLLFCGCYNFVRPSKMKKAESISLKSLHNEAENDINEYECNKAEENQGINELSTSSVWEVIMTDLYYIYTFWQVLNSLKGYFVFRWLNNRTTME